MMQDTVVNQLIEEIEGEAERLFKNCPDEIKRFHYGIITHSDAGKYSMNQYFGHWVHSYSHYQYISGAIPGSLKRLANDPAFTLEHIKKMFVDMFLDSSLFFREYGGQSIIAIYTSKVVDVLDAIDDKSDFLKVFDAYQTLVSRLYWWFHWYFPWGIGPVAFQRLEPEDIAEINRLAGTTG